MPIPDTTIRVDRERPRRDPPLSRPVPRLSRPVPREKPDSGHAGTISIAIRACRTGWNVMNPRIQRVLTQ